MRNRARNGRATQSSVSSGARRSPSVLSRQAAGPVSRAMVADPQVLTRGRDTRRDGPLPWRREARNERRPAAPRMAARPHPDPGGLSPPGRAPAFAFPASLRRLGPPSASRSGAASPASRWRRPGTTASIFDNAESHAQARRSAGGRRVRHLRLPRDGWCVSSKADVRAVDDPRPTQQGLSRAHDARMPRRAEAAAGRLPSTCSVPPPDPRSPDRRDGVGDGRAGPPAGAVLGHLGVECEQIRRRGMPWRAHHLPVAPSLEHAAAQPPGPAAGGWSTRRHAAFGMAAQPPLAAGLGPVAPAVQRRYPGRVVAGARGYTWLQRGLRRARRGLCAGSPALAGEL